MKSEQWKHVFLTQNIFKDTQWNEMFETILEKKVLQLKRITVLGTYTFQEYQHYLLKGYGKSIKKIQLPNKNRVGLYYIHTAKLLLKVLSKARNTKNNNTFTSGLQKLNKSTMV